MRAHTTHHAAALEFNSAEEAERLRRDLERHANHASQITQLRAELDRLQAERDALRKALAGAVNVLDLLRTYADVKYDYASSRAGTLVHVARTIDAATALLTPNAGDNRREASG